MALANSHVDGTSVIHASDVDQFFILLTGIMTDQLTTLANGLVIQKGSQTIALVVTGPTSDTDNTSTTTTSQSSTATAITSGTLMGLTTTTSAFTGVGLLMNYASGSGTFTGKFFDLQVNGVSKFYVDS